LRRRVQRFRANRVSFGACMARPRRVTPQDKLALQALQAQLIKPPITGIEFPIRLTPRASFLAGRAALVFVAPHVLTPADDFVEFGYHVLGTDEDAPYGTNVVPHDGARIVAWFRPPEVGRKYNVEFFCGGHQLDSFTLESSDGETRQSRLPARPILRSGLGKRSPLTSPPMTMTGVGSASRQPATGNSSTAN
jgi:hypothetical protein